MATPSSTATAPLRETDRFLGTVLQAVRRALGAEHCALIRDGYGDRATDDGFLSRARVHLHDPATTSAIIASCRVAPGDGAEATLVVEWADGDRALQDAPALDALATYLAELLIALDQAEPTAQAYEALFRIGTRLHSVSGDVDDVLELIVDEASALLKTDMAWLCLVTDDGKQIYPAVIRGFRDEGFLSLTLEVGRGVGGVAIAEHRAIIIGDYGTHVHDTSDAVRRAVIDEGVVSMICAPMFKDDMMVGALYVANRTYAPFADVDAALLCALAAQASIAIHNRRLYERLSAQNDLLERAFDVHRQLTQASLEGVGVAGIGNVLVKLIGHPIVIEQDICDPPVIRCPADMAPTEPDAPSITHAIVAGHRPLGSVTVVGTRTLAPLQAKALEHGTTVLALELVKQRSAAEVEWRLSGELLDELLDLSGPPSDMLARRARHLGVEIDSPHRMLALAQDGDQGSPYALLAIVRQLMMRRTPHNVGRALSAKRGGLVVLALPPALEDAAGALAHDIQRATADEGGTVSVGVGALSHDFGETYRAAAACLALARNAGAPGMVVQLDTLGPLRFLLDATDVAQSAAMIRETLDSVIAHDAKERTPLLPTLRAFVECDGHYERTAQRLYVAVSTLKYRLRKLREVLGESPSDPDLHFRLRLAFNLLDLMEAMGADDALGRSASRDTVSLPAPGSLPSTAQRRCR
jgi:GAF domain-containing protein/sugar diacid utilization regulator